MPKYAVVQINTALLIRNRTERGLFQKDLAEAVGITKGHMCDIEAGRKQPSPPLLSRIAEALGIEPARLLDEDAA